MLFALAFIFQKTYDECLVTRDGPEIVTDTAYIARGTATPMILK
jgi:hypothetical protein